MDFFQYQEKARKRTTLLVVLYVVAVVFLIGAVYALFVFIGSMAGGEQYARQLEKNSFLDPTLLPLVVGGVSLLVLGGSFFKTAQLSSGGGRAVAEMMGGRQISPGSGDPAERRLYNVVEEISLASGVPVPPIYILDDEPSINAFAAGVSPTEAVIAVNRGTMELLTRDELQGVIAHEFSHILNGDMRISMRLIGVLFGLQLLAVIGYYAMRFSYYASMGSSSSNGKNNGAALGLVMLLAGLGVMIIGYIGVFFSAIIKAAISRQREYLADASAVQFTRMTDGIAGALKKIGSPNIGSDVKNEHAAEASHMFFGDVCPLFSLGGLLSTHPDLVTRIKRLDPSFDGRFPARVEPVNIAAERAGQATKGASAGKSSSPLDPLRRLDPTSGVAKIGNLDLGQILVAGALLDSIPDGVADAARNPLTAKATFYAMLLDSDEAIRRGQIQAVAVSETDYVVRQTQQIYATLAQAAPEAKIPLAQRVSASLQQLTLAQYKQFSGVVDRLIAADNKMDLFEYTLKAILFRNLDVYFGLTPPPTVKYHALGAVRGATVAVLSYLAHVGHDNDADVRAAYTAAQNELGLADPILSDSACTVKLFDESLRKLAETSPPLKQRIYNALMTCIRHDGQITVQEGELMRAVAAMLGIPMPNFS